MHPTTYHQVNELINTPYARFALASSTACTYDPEFGTTTLKTIGFYHNGTSTATTVTIAKATADTNATTTPIWTADFSAGIKGNLLLHASSTEDSDFVDPIWVLAPGDVINIDVQGLINNGSTTTLKGLVSEGWTTNSKCYFEAYAN